MRARPVLAMLAALAASAGGLLHAQDQLRALPSYGRPKDAEAYGIRDER